MDHDNNGNSSRSDDDFCSDPKCYYTSTTQEMIDDIMNSSNSNSSSSYYDTTLSFPTVATSALIGYRSVGIGCFGAIMRYIGMPLEKIALYMNSSQVTTITTSTSTSTTTTSNGSTSTGISSSSSSLPKSQFQQAIALTFREGYISPYRVVGMNSMIAWFMQYSVMGIAFQFFDTMIANALHIQPMYYGRELMEPPPPSSSSSSSSSSYVVRESFKAILSPLLASSLESLVSNRAEVQRFYGPNVFQQVLQQSYSNLRPLNPMIQYTGPAYIPNVMRNIIMCQTSFIITPYTYKMYVPQEYKNKTSLFYYGLSLNIFVGNVIAITQQAIWGRTLDYLQRHNTIHYGTILRDGYRNEGIGAFFTTSKWMSRVLMNAPAQGTLPWFYNEILPLGEYTFLYTLYHYFYRPIQSIYDITTATTKTTTNKNNDNNPTKPTTTTKATTNSTTNGIPTVLAEATLNETVSNKKNRQLLPCNIQRTRTHYGTLPTANPEFDEDDDIPMDTHNKKHHHHHHHHHKVIHHPTTTTTTTATTTTPSQPSPQQQSSSSTSTER